jgi:hypothetical protein
MLEDMVHTAAEVKFTLKQAMNAPSASRDIALLFS